MVGIFGICWVVQFVPASEGLLALITYGGYAAFKIIVEHYCSNFLTISIWCKPSYLSFYRFITNVFVGRFRESKPTRNSACWTRSWPLSSDRAIPSCWWKNILKNERLHRSRTRSVPLSWRQLAGGCFHHPHTLPIRNIIHRAPTRLEPALSPPKTNTLPTELRNLDLWKHRNSDELIGFRVSVTLHS